MSRRGLTRCRCAESVRGRTASQQDDRPAHRQTKPKVNANPRNAQGRRRWARRPKCATKKCGHSVTDHNRQKILEMKPKARSLPESAHVPVSSRRPSPGQTEWARRSIGSIRRDWSREPPRLARPARAGLSPTCSRRPRARSDKLLPAQGSKLLPKEDCGQAHWWARPIVPRPSPAKVYQVPPRGGRRCPG